MRIHSVEHQLHINSMRLLYMPRFMQCCVRRRYAALQSRQEFTFDAMVGGPVRLAADSSQCLTAVSPGERGSGLTVTACAMPLGKGQSWAPMPNASTSSLQLQNGGAVGLQNGGLTNAVLWLGPGQGLHDPDGTVDPMVRSPRPPLVSFRQGNASTTRGVFVVTPRGGFNQAVGCGKGCSLCMSFGKPVRPCDRPSPVATLPMCDVSLPVKQRVADLVGRVPASDVAELLVNVAGPVHSLWVTPTNWWSEALHGVQSGCVNIAGGKSRCPVSFPAAITTAASFNKSLFYEIGNAIGTEARAMSNVGAADGWSFWSPNLNIVRVRSALLAPIYHSPATCFGGVKAASQDCNVDHSSA